MLKSQSLNPSENQNKLLSRSSNFLNNQNYILGKSEKKKVLASFLSVKYFDKFLIFVYVLFIILAILFFLKNLYFISLFLILLSIFAFYKSEKFRKKEIKKFRDIITFKEENLYNSTFVFVVYTIILTIIYINGLNYLLNNYFSGLVTIFYNISILFVLFLTFLKLKFLTKINYSNIFLLPFLVFLGIIIYIFIYSFSFFKKYQIYVSNPLKLSLVNFINNKGLYSNGYYEISKK